MLRLALGLTALALLMTCAMARSIPEEYGISGLSGSYPGVPAIGF